MLVKAVRILLLLGNWLEDVSTEMQWNCLGSGMGYAAWYMAGPWLRLRGEDPECCLPMADGQYCELKEENDALRSGMPGGGAWSWEAATHIGHTHRSPDFREWQEPADSPCRG